MGTRVSGQDYKGGEEARSAPQYIYPWRTTTPRITLPHFIILAKSNLSEILFSLLNLRILKKSQMAKGR